jgi:hypothetical protein
MRYLLLIYGDEGREGAPRYAEYSALARDLGDRLVGGDELQPVATATSVRIRGGETLIIDGPFAETKEQLGGYFLIDADSLDEAIRWAERMPAARDGTVEIRPVVSR